MYAQSSSAADNADNRPYRCGERIITAPDKTRACGDRDDRARRNQRASLSPKGTTNNVELKIT